MKNVLLSACGEDEFACEYGLPRCTNIQNKCDGINHCQDASDEKDCSE